MSSRRILVTGATGFIGGRLARRLIADGYHVRCLVRDSELPAAVALATPDASWPSPTSPVRGACRRPWQTSTSPISSCT